MTIEEDRLIIEDETTDEALEELIEMLNNPEVQIVQIDTDNISSLCLQQIFCVAKEKKIEINNSFIEKFFDNINYN